MFYCIKQYATASHVDQSGLMSNVVRNEPSLQRNLGLDPDRNPPAQIPLRGRAVLLRRWRRSVCLGSVTRADHRKFGVFFFVSNLSSAAPPKLWKRVEKFPRCGGLTRQDQRAARRTMYLRLLNNESIRLITPPFLPSSLWRLRRQKFQA